MTLTVDQRVDQLGLTLVSILTELRHMRADLAERAPAQSSVEIKSSARGQDVTVKAYAGSDTHAAGEGAIEEYVRLVEEVQRRLNGGA